MTSGNHTASAEFNAFADPEALAIVLSHGLPLRMVDLDACRKVTASSADVLPIRNAGGKNAGLIADLLEGFIGIATRRGRPAMALYDPVAAVAFTSEFLGWRRSGGSGRLEVDSILATFGLLFVIQGIMLVVFGGNYHSYSYLADGVDIFGTTVALNRLLSFCLSMRRVMPISWRSASFFPVRPPARSVLRSGCCGQARSARWRPGRRLPCHPPSSSFSSPWLPPPLRGRSAPAD